MPINNNSLEESLLRTQALIRTIANYSPFGVLLVDNRTDQILYANERFCKVWGLERICSKILSGQLKNNDIIPDCILQIKNVQAFAESCKPLQNEENRTVIEDEIEFIDGRVIKRFSTQVRDDDDRYFGRLYFFEDVTNSKIIEKQLKESKANLRNLVHEKTDELRQVVKRLQKEITEHKELQKQYQFLATHDSLTKVYNSYAFEEALKVSKQNANQGKKVALLCVDLDNFKNIKCTLGHIVADELLSKVTDLLTKTLRKDDVIARLGGDKFGVLLNGTNEKDATLVAEKVRKAIQDFEFIIGNDYWVNVTVSIGVVFIDGTKHHNELLTLVDSALFDAKEKGRNRVVVVSSQEDIDKFEDTLEMVSKIREAIKENKFILYYQPIYSVTDGQVSHNEALLRIKDDHALLTPDKFIPIAERFGLMPQIDRWVISTAVDTLKQFPGLTLFVNISGVSLGDTGLLSFIEEKIIDSQVDPSRLGFEITETSAIKDFAKAEKWIKRLKDIGCPFALDDFGVGFSSFSYLGNLPVDYLKIDGSFIRRLHNDKTQLALVRAMNTVAHTLNKETIAEFVENQEILELLQQIGINHGQGYHLCKPTPTPVLG